MEHLYAPWRREYHKKGVEGCPFCWIWNHPEEDLENWVLHRGESCFWVMNRFPYNPGHFMIIPARHIGKYQQLTEGELCEIARHSQIGVELLERWGAKGVNLGWNLGWVGGAGIPDHIHLHLVPRFDRDTNMMTTIFGTRVYSADFEQVYRELRELLTHLL